MRSQTTSSSKNLTTVIDFNRNRSNESTEAVGNMKGNIDSNNQFSSSASSCSGMSAHSAEGRGVPISPKKMPATPPRDAGSPASFGYGATPPSSQPSSFFSNSAVPIFPSMKMMASSWRTKDEAQASVFRSPPNTMLSSRSSSGGSGINAFFSIQRCNAFDEDDMIDDEEDEVFCYSDDEEDDDDNDMAGMFGC
ncbi:hypothetical protein FRACYDRAFT_272689 [Fragilariopsis cylindrus CCMP1102]|uniref:Uncharacterized protein n=1 Tax=Fragilariopsis cylindrus CCMP1102 TaxID=635003 RepID=A0A1E7EL45_9STRA|nr:hypothetical protein FRACYDRAFT_272689 [Fragilariopsis cylindrus CCMP1102]|eukprot:OEU06606.1 hypothetical protein FRACYDRAFT_272689 [Fragilariopsis cylindrus CCMP1102]